LEAVWPPIPSGVLAANTSHVPDPTAAILAGITVENFLPVAFLRNPYSIIVPNNRGVVKHDKHRLS
jgi:hypothetical protein